MSRKKILMMRARGLPGPFFSSHKGIPGLSKSVGNFITNSQEVIDIPFTIDLTSITIDSTAITIDKTIT